MSERQAKLIRYYEHLTGDKKLPGQLRKYWPLMRARDKGKVTKYMRRACAVRAAIQNEQIRRNSDVLKGFTQ